MNEVATVVLADHMGAALLVAAIIIGLTVRIAVMVSQKHRTFPHR